LKFYAKHVPGPLTGALTRKQGFSRHILILCILSGIPVPLCFYSSQFRIAAHNFLKLIEMKATSYKNRKTYMDEFEDYIESVYDIEGDYESISDELLEWEYERFLEMMEE